MSFYMLVTIAIKFIIKYAYGTYLYNLLIYKKYSSFFYFSLIFKIHTVHNPLFMYNLFHKSLYFLVNRSISSHPAGPIAPTVIDPLAIYPPINKMIIPE